MFANSALGNAAMSGSAYELSCLEVTAASSSGLETLASALPVKTSTSCVVASSYDYQSSRRMVIDVGEPFQSAGHRWLSHFIDPEPYEVKNSAMFHSMIT